MEIWTNTLRYQFHFRIIENSKRKYIIFNNIYNSNKLGYSYVVDYTSIKQYI